MSLSPEDYEPMDGAAPNVTSDGTIQQAKSGETAILGEPQGAPDGKTKNSPSSQHAQQSRIRRRNRMITSCLECRRRKLKCDKVNPCSNCSKFSRDCVFLAPALDSASQKKLTEIKEQMGTLERVLERDVANKKEIPVRQKHATENPSVELPGQQDVNSDEEVPEREDEKNLEPTPLAVMDAAFDDDTNDDMADIGIKMGRLRLTERIGGFIRPKMTEELTFTLNDPSMDHRNEQEKLSALPTSPGGSEEFLEPGPTYIAPGAGFVFGDVGLRTNLMDFLPAKIAADTLLEQYIKAVHPLCRTVHWPSFMIQYENFWTNVSLGIEPAASVQALVFSILFAAVASMDDMAIVSAFSRPKRAVLTNFQTGTELALSKSHFLRSTKLEVMQALVTYLIPMCCAELSRAHSVLVGMAVRLGEQMGLYRDPKENYNAAPVDTHVRRMIWFQLCILDIRTNQSNGPRPIIRRDDYDTKFPFNIDDTDLVSGDPKDSDTIFTDMTITRMRMECAEMARVMVTDRARLEKKQITLTHLLGKIEAFRKAMEAKYFPILDESIPLHKWARLCLGIHTNGMHIGVLHRYHNSVSVRIPDRLRQIIINSGTAVTENAVKLDTLPELKPWRWINGALQQWHIAFLLLVEVFAYPMRKEAPRIWRCLDYVFDTDASLSPAVKGRMILTELRDKISVYRDIRKIRAPVSMMNRLYQKAPRRAKEATDPNLPMNVNGPPVYDTAGLTETAWGQQSDSLSPIATNHVGQHGSSSSASPANSSDPGFHRWSFDAPSTYLVPGRFGPMKNHNASTQHMPGDADMSRLSGISPPPADFASPSVASTNDSWPPYITQGQQGWDNPLEKHEQSQPPSGPQQTQQYNDNKLSSPSTNAQANNKSKANAVQQQHPAAAVNPRDLMMDIDWHEWDKIFPPDMNTGDLDMPRDIDFNAMPEMLL